MTKKKQAYAGYSISQTTWLNSYEEIDEEVSVRMWYDRGERYDSARADGKEKERNRKPWEKRQKNSADL
ncbi:hypothetical protein H1A12_07695 [Sellimonas intestinalis]|nr:hypothetical protein [Sellimonas intestinalis]